MLGPILWPGVTMDHLIKCEHTGIAGSIGTYLVWLELLLEPIPPRFCSADSILERRLFNLIRMALGSEKVARQMVRSSIEVKVTEKK